MYKVSKETYEKVFNSCRGMCVLNDKDCKGRLALHHICGRGKFLTDEPTNCVMLCGYHHEMVHGNLKKYRPILLDIASNIYGVHIYAGPQKG